MSRPYAHSHAPLDTPPTQLQELLARISTEHAPAPELLQSWVAHPDERVTDALFRQRKLARALSDDQRLFLVARATASADKRSVLWTPSLDTISFAFVTYQLRTPAIRASITSLDDRLRLLRRWLTTTADRDDVGDLMRFRSPQVGDIVARSANLDGALAAPLITSEWRCHLLLTNPRAPQGVLDRVLAFTFKRLRTRRGWSSSPSGMIAVLRTLALGRGTFPSLPMIKDILHWQDGLFLRLAPEARHYLEQIIVATGEHHARSGTLDREAITAFLACPAADVRLHALGWLAKMAVPSSAC